MTNLRKVVNKIAKIESYVGAFFLAVFFVCTVIGVLTRYVPFIRVIWTEEIARYSFIWSVFLGTSVMVYENDHFSFEYIRTRVKGIKKLAIESFIYILIMGFNIYLIIAGLQLTSQFWDWSINSLPWLKQRYIWPAIFVSGLSTLIYCTFHLYEIYFNYKRGVK